MKYAASFLPILLIIIVVGCASSHEALNERYPDLVEINPPNRIPYIEQEIAIDSMRIVQIRNDQAIIINGSFPDSCTQILRLEDSLVLGNLNLNFIGWKKYGESCSGGTASFTFLYDDLTKEEFRSVDVVSVNGKNFDMKSSASN